MTEFCRLVVTTGPDRGKVFEPDDEVVHIGRGDGNHVTLTDPSLHKHHLSLLRKNGRYAAFRPEGSEVLVDGSEIPGDKWVWLPSDARLQFGRRTSCQFSFEGHPKPRERGTDTLELQQSAIPQLDTEGDSWDDSEADASRGISGTDTRSGGNADRELPAVPGFMQAAATRRSAVKMNEEPVAAPEPAPSVKAVSEAGRERKRKREGRRNVARFITDQGGPRVELGAEGQLPELALEEGEQQSRAETKRASTSPVVLYCLLGLSFAMSIGLLLVDPTPPSKRSITRAQAREEIVEFFSTKDRPPEPWQMALRRARLAYSRGDERAELAEYRRVIDALNSEDRNPLIGLTGHKSSDDNLRQLIGHIIGE